MTTPRIWNPIIVNEGEPDQYASMEERPDGDYVERIDYQKLQGEFLKFKAEVAVACEELQAKLNRLK